MFSFFSRKPAPQPENAAGSISPPRTSVQQLRTPSPSVDSSSAGKANNSPSFSVPGPPITPSPPPAELGLITDTTPLRDLISSIPPKTVHEYILSHLEKQPAPATLTHLTSFFSALAPPPKLHCVRCHKFYFEVENTDRSCLVPHDDDSAEVERVGGRSTDYETLWGCCGKTVEGDGDMGPPDGWCYEGTHTTDYKRARFRADSTIHDDKLTSCERMKCFNPPPSSHGSTSSEGSPKRARSRKRPRQTDPQEDEQDEADDAKSTISRHTAATHRRKKAKKMEEEESEDDAKSTTSRRTTSKAPARRKKPRKSAADRAEAAAFKPTPQEEEETDVEMTDAASTATTRRRKPSAAALKKAGTSSAPASPSGKPRPPASKHAKSKSTAFELPSASIKSSLKGKKPAPKPLTEVVATSVDGEEAW